MNFGALELTVILVIVLLLFGGKKLPKLARSIGDSLNILRKSVDEGDPDKDKGSDKEKK